MIIFLSLIKTDVVLKLKEPAQDVGIEKCLIKTDVVLKSLSLCPNMDAATVFNKNRCCIEIDISVAGKQLGFEFNKNRCCIEMK